MERIDWIVDLIAQERAEFGLDQLANHLRRHDDPTLIEDLKAALDKATA